MNKLTAAAASDINFALSVATDLARDYGITDANEFLDMVFEDDGCAAISAVWSHGAEAVATFRRRLAIAIA